MKIRITRFELLSYLVIVNLLLIAGVIFVISLINKNNIISEDVGASAAIPFLATVNANVSSRSYIVYDTKSRVIIAGKNENLRFSPASTAKIMTALISLETYKSDDVFDASKVSEVEGSKMGLEEGERIRVISLLYGLMLPSGNDAAYVLAKSYPGGAAEFIRKMNGRAKDLEMLNTKFFDPAGYDDNNYTTALDLARLAAYAIKDPMFAKIVSTKSITVADESGKIIHELKNINVLLGHNGVTGIKTGFTDEAGGVLVTSIKRGDRTYIVVVLNSPDRFLDTQNVINQIVDKVRLLFY